MLTRTRKLTCRSRSDAGGSGAPTHAIVGTGGRTLPTNGMVLAVVMIVATLILVALTAVLPSVFQEGQREREKETIFRGYQYARAVALFHKQFNRYPVSVKELAQQTNGMRFLRQEYRDPLDPKGKWRFIHVNAAGVLLDSVNQPLLNPNNPNNSNNPAGIGQGSSSNSTFGGNSAFGGSNSSGFQLGSSSLGLQGGVGGLGTSSPVGDSNQIGPTSSFFSSDNQIQGAYIAGVAPTSRHESIKIWNKHHRYDEWEFIGIDMGVFGVQVGTGASSFGQQTPSQGIGTSPGSFGNTNNSPSNFGPSSN
jgi:type II secretory pathway pseudopilin PulG